MINSAHLFSLLVLLMAAPLGGASTFVSSSDAASGDLQQQLRAALADKGPDYKPRTAHFDADGQPLHTNRLILEQSPYLIQHAHNPVNWYPWGAEAFAAARAANKPIFLSIGYSTCHWCHVMERESFEHNEVAALLNREFIAIKVDRERRPDVDETYMIAANLYSGRGGWPMSAFLTPDGEPIFAGTYFPRDEFLKLAGSVARVWKDDEPGARAQARRVAEATTALNARKSKAAKLDALNAMQGVANLMQARDELQGGFGTAPKFPREPALHLLIDYALRNDDPIVMGFVVDTLKAMAMGGLRDQVGGGFHRYAIDADWQIPHFEKMLYNQAQLGRLYLEAYRWTGDEFLLDISHDTLNYVLAEMTGPNGAFYSASDAESAPRAGAKPEEGAYFIWAPEQIDALVSSRPELGETWAEKTKRLFNINALGNFQGHSVPHLSAPVRLHSIAKLRNLLRQERDKRPRPGVDKKRITAWNGMMITAFAEAASGVARQGDVVRYREAAAAALNWLKTNHWRANGELLRASLPENSATARRADRTVAATLEDYAWLARASLAVHQLTDEPEYLTFAEQVFEQMVQRFADPEGGGLFMNQAAGESASTLFVRPKRAEDSAMASGSSVALEVAAMLAKRVEGRKHEQIADDLIATFAERVAEFPDSYPYFLSAERHYRDGGHARVQFAGEGHVTLEAGRVAEREIRIRIRLDEHWHINSAKPLEDSLIATQVALLADPEWAVERVIYPEPSVRRLGFSQQPLSLFEGTIEIRVLLKRADNRQAPTRISLPLQIRFQACSDSVCLAPETLPLRWPRWSSE